LRLGRRIAIDVGSKRIGVASSDEHGILASPVATVSSLAECLQFIDTSVLEIYVGLPVNLQGVATESTATAIKFAREIAASTQSETRLIDERLTTSLANNQLREIGKTQRQSRQTIDQMAAVAILEYALQIERASGRIPGVAIGEYGND